MREEKMELEETEVDTSPSWSPVSRDRLLTCANLSDITGKKRKQDPSSDAEHSARILEDCEDDDFPISDHIQDSEGPCNKRVKPVYKSASVTGIITPMKTPALKRLGQSIQRSISFRTEARPLPPMPIRTRQKASSFPRRRNSQLWSDTVDSLSHELSTKEIKRQEVIYELTQGEKQLIEDLSLVKKVYYEPMLKLDIMTESELGQIFGTLDSLIPLHEDLLARLEGLRGAEKTVQEVGPTMMDWMELIQRIITEVNLKTGEAECQFYRRGLCYSEDSQRVSEIQASRFLYCHGELKSTKGQKLHVFLFELVLVLTRPVAQDREGPVQFQVYRQPLPAAHLHLEDLPDGEPSSSGSFRGAFTGNDKVKNCFRVSATGRSKSQSHSLQANDSFNKQQWISCLRQAMVQSRDRQAQSSHCKPSERLSPDPALYNNIAELNLNSDVEMPDT
ncbi:rho guanine nucleotide exchange factor 3-like [Sinocyclocheilus anshuiensis]|uniref:rho guanine nucleotide exchange factor 3-like n=1 Tax=Sinocyclocheilus anshuiensis TaxID=1608454 RepID=UPI0007BA5C28|nr:PREDICTED: rho guanine nucleotide exchange factor 3-like [Sinocyclocheilus anshuiensis]